MSEDEKEWAKIIIPSFMKALCRMDNEVNRGERKGGNTFTIAEIHQEAVLKSFPPANTAKAKIIRGYGIVKDPFIDVDKDDKVTLTNKGRTWCSEPDEAELLLV